MQTWQSSRSTTSGNGKKPPRVGTALANNQGMKNRDLLLAELDCVTSGEEEPDFRDGCALHFCPSDKGARKVKKNP